MVLVGVGSSEFDSATSDVEEERDRDSACEPIVVSSRTVIRSVEIDDVISIPQSPSTYQHIESEKDVDGIYAPVYVAHIEAVSRGKGLRRSHLVSNCLSFILRRERRSAPSVEHPFCCVLLLYYIDGKRREPPWSARQESTFDPLVNFLEVGGRSRD